MSSVSTTATGGASSTGRGGIDFCHRRGVLNRGGVDYCHRSGCTGRGMLTEHMGSEDVVSEDMGREDMGSEDILISD